jgi:hypothetical protein
VFTLSFYVASTLSIYAERKGRKEKYEKEKLNKNLQKAYRS